MLDYLLRKFWRYRKAVGLSFFYFGLPIVYFLRDGVKLAPGNSAFTAAMVLGSLVLVLPKNMFKSIYMPNVLAYWISFVFLFLSLIYLFFYCPNAGWFTNQPASAGSIFIIMGVYILLTTVSMQELRETFAPATFVIGTLGCLCVVYYVLKNPLYVVGMKAGINLGTEDASTTNSHVFGKGGFATAMAGIVLLNQYKGFKRLVVLGGTFLGVMVLLSAQSMSSILAFGVALSLYGYYHVSIPRLILRTYRLLWNYRFLLVFGLTIFISVRLWDQYFLFKGTVQAVTGRVERIYNTVFLGEHTNFRQGDMSASDRLGHMTLVVEGLEYNYKKGNWGYILFGNGYEVLYVDSPVLQSFNDFGLFGLLLYAGLLVVLMRSVLLTMRDKNNAFTNLIGTVFCLILVQNFSAGMVIDYPKWCYFALIARFAIAQFYYRPSAPPLIQHS